MIPTEQPSNEEPDVEQHSHEGDGVKRDDDFEQLHVLSLQLLAVRKKSSSVTPARQRGRSTTICREAAPRPETYELAAAVVRILSETCGMVLLTKLLRQSWSIVILTGRCTQSLTRIVRLALLKGEGG